MKQIFFVGYSKERLLRALNTLKDYPTDKVILIVGKQNAEENILKKIAEEVVENELKLWNVEIVEIDKENILNATYELIQLIKGQNEEDTILNISGSLWTFAVAAYISASITGSRLISSIPVFSEKGEEIDVKGFIEIPVLPIDFPNDDQIDILTAIGDGVNSLDEIVSRLPPPKPKGGGYIRGVRIPKHERSKSGISHHLSKIEAKGFVRKTKVGRNVRIELTALGKMFIELRRLGMRNNDNLQ